MAKSKSPPPPTDSWSARLRYALDEAQIEGRSQKGMDSSTLAKTINSANSTVSSWTAGRVEISVSKLIEVCKVLNIREEWLLHGKLPMRPEPDSSDKALALSKLLHAFLQEHDAHGNFLNAIGSDTLQLFIGKMAALFSDQDINLIASAIAAKKLGEQGEIATALALTILGHAGNLNSNCVQLIQSAMAATKFGKTGDVAMELALAALVQLNLSYITPRIADDISEAA